MSQNRKAISFAVEGVAGTPAILLLHSPKAPRAVMLAGETLNSFDFSATQQLLWVHFTNEAKQRELAIAF
jgi:hypothetical protein